MNCPYAQMDWFCELPKDHEGPHTMIVDARQADATTCPSCRVAVNLGQFCSCPMRWKG